jgi:hypothetical protein
MTLVSNSFNVLSQASVHDPPADGLLVKNLAMRSLWYLASAACKSLTAEFALLPLFPRHHFFHAHTSELLL